MSLADVPNPTSIRLVLVNRRELFILLIGAIVVIYIIFNVLSSFIVLYMH